LYASSAFEKIQILWTNGQMTEELLGIFGRTDK